MPRPQPAAYQVLEQFVSESQPHLVHEVRLGADEVMYCTCTAWRMKQGKASCKHLDEYIVRRGPLKKAGPREELRWNRIQLRDVIECNSRGAIFLLKVDTIDEPDDRICGVQLLDPGQPSQSLNSQRQVHIRDVVRVVVRAGR